MRQKGNPVKNVEVKDLIIALELNYGLLISFKIIYPMSKLVKIKTTETEASVEDFINALPDEQKKKDSFTILKMMQKASGEKPKIWGSSIIGFGNKRYKSPKTGREVDWFKIGFAPRKANLSLYLVMNIQEQASMLKKLGKHKTGVGCLYVNKLDDIDIKVLEAMIDASLKKK